MPLCATVFLSMSAVTTSGLLEITGGRGRVSVHSFSLFPFLDMQVCGQRGRNVTVALAVLPVNGLVFHSAYIGGMNAPRFNAFLAQTRQNLDPDEDVIFIYDGAPAHRNPAIPSANTELEMLPAYRPFLNIVEQAIRSLKAAIKGDILRPEIQARMDDRAEARRLGIPVGRCEPDCYSILFSAA